MNVVRMKVNHVRWGLCEAGVSMTPPVTFKFINLNHQLKIYLWIIEAVITLHTWLLTSVTSHFWANLILLHLQTFLLLSTLNYFLQPVLSINGAGGLAVGNWPAFTLEKTYQYYSKILPDSLSTTFSSYLSLLRWNFCLQEINLILFTTMCFMPKKGV